MIGPKAYKNAVEAAAKVVRAQDKKYAPNYLTGKRSTYSNGDRLRQAHLDAYPEERPYLERNGPRLAFLCIVSLVALGSVSWGWPLFCDWLIGYVGVDVD